MSLSVWEYLRRRTADAVLAGVRDAFDVLERSDQAQLQHVAAQQLRQRLGELEKSPASEGRATARTPESSPPQPNPIVAPAHRDTNSGERRPPLPAPAANESRPASNPATQDSTSRSLPFPEHRRGPGRPRKETHG